MISVETFRALTAEPAQYDYTTVAGPDPTHHDYTNLGTLSAYFESMRKSANL